MWKHVLVGRFKILQFTSRTSPHFFVCPANLSRINVLEQLAVASPSPLEYSSGPGRTMPDFREVGKRAPMHLSGDHTARSSLGTNISRDLPHLLARQIDYPGKPQRESSQAKDGQQDARAYHHTPSWDGDRHATCQPRLSPQGLHLIQEEAHLRRQRELQGDSKAPLTWINRADRSQVVSFSDMHFGERWGKRRFILTRKELIMRIGNGSFAAFGPESVCVSLLSFGFFS